MPDSIRIALVLKPEHRTAGGIARVRLMASTLGIDVTAIGGAVVSGTVSVPICELLFGITTAGARPTIAQPLNELVESVAILPTPRRPRGRHPRRSSE